MNVQTAVAPAVSTAGVRPALAILAGCALFWLLLFHAEAAAAVRIWTTSTAYGHCFLVLPVAAWLAWERRGALAERAPRPFPLACLAALPLCGVWFLAERLGVMEGRQLAAVALLLLLVLAVLGPRLWWGFAVPLAYLFFLVPFGGFLVGPLQVFTARFIDVGLDVLGIAHVVTRFMIEIPEGTFRVAEACAGLRFLIAAIAFGVVYASTIYRSTRRRVAFIAASLLVPVIANGFRALGIVVLGHILGSAQAGAVDHILYGWIFFSIVILLLILAGLPFRQDAGPLRPGRPRHAPPPAAPVRLLAAGAGILLVSAAAPAAPALLDAQAALQQQEIPAGSGGAILARLVTPPDCARLAADRFDCAGVGLAVRVQVFAPRSSPASLIAALRAPTAGIDLDNATVEDWPMPLERPAAWEVTETDAGTKLIAVALVTHATAEGAGLTMRVHQGLASILGGAAAPVLVTVTASQGRLPVSAPNTVLRRFLERQHGLLPAAAS